MSTPDVLNSSRDLAKVSRGYDSEKTRATICRKFRDTLEGKEPYTWQINVCEALLLGLDCVVIAPTGAGKTMPFIMPLLVDETCRKMVIIISPLNELEYDQVRSAVLSVTFMIDNLNYRSRDSKKWAFLQLQSTEKSGTRPSIRYVIVHGQLSLSERFSSRKSFAQNIGSSLHPPKCVLTIRSSRLSYARPNS